MREVPDHQEVYTDDQTDESVIVEILSLAPGNSMEEAAAAHWQSLLRLNHAQAAKVEEVVVTNLSDTLPLLAVPATLPSAPEALLLWGHMMAPKFNETALNSIDVYICLLRIQQFATDVLIILNSPTAVNPQSSSAASFLAPNPEGALALFKEVVSSFQIQDWGLFQ